MQRDRLLHAAHGLPARLANICERAGAVAAAQELFDVDLANDTLTRVTQSYEAPRANRRMRSPARLVLGRRRHAGFSSGANNLVYGDGNGASDAFVVRRKRFPVQPVAAVHLARARQPDDGGDWLLGLSATSQPDAACCSKPRCRAREPCAPRAGFGPRQAL